MGPDNCHPTGRMQTTWLSASMISTATRPTMVNGRACLPASSPSTAVALRNNATSSRDQATAARSLGQRLPGSLDGRLQPVPSAAPFLDGHENRDVIGMLGNADRHAPGAPTSVPRGLVTALAGPPRPVDAATPATWFMPARSWDTVPPESFLAWNAFRLTEFAGLVLRTHVPHGPRAVLVFHACVPALRLPALRCGSCADSRWPCRLVAWARDWIVRLPAVVEALEHPSRLADRVSMPVAVGDMQIPAVTWDTSSTRGEEVS
jgi:hypothetical protein